MKKIKLLTAFTLLLSSFSANAALISVGPFALEDTATTSSATSPVNLNGTNGLSSITDLSLSTYIFGQTATDGTSLSGNIDLGFSSNMYNSTGDDLVFYFVRGIGDATSASFDLSINNSTLSYSATEATFVAGDGTTQKYQVEIGTGFADLLIATINLDDFNIAANAAFMNLNISGINNDERLAMVGAFYPTPVPLPAAFFLFLSGLTGLGIIGRRKK